MSRADRLPVLPIALVLALLSPVGAAAATFTVTNLADSGSGSLRQAVLDANASAGADEVVFAPGLTGTITLTSGEMVISDPLVVHGPGLSVLTVSGADQFRIFLVEKPAVEAPIDVTLSGLTLTHGRGLPVVPSPAGGAVLAYGENLTILGSVISNSLSGTLNNLAEVGCGGNLALLGPMAAGGATLRIVDSKLTGGRVTGTAGRTGGNLCVIGRLLMEHSTLSGGGFVGEGTSYGGGLALRSAATDNSIAFSIFSGNQAQESGGGILLDSVSGLTIESSTVADNSAEGRTGGGITNSDSGLRVLNSTISGNTAGEGGGIFSDGGTLEVVNGTISGNRTTFFGGGVYGRGPVLLRLTTVTGNTANLRGGGISFETSFVSGGVTLDHSIVGKNTPEDMTYTGMIPGGVESNYSLVEAPGIVFVGGGVHNLIGADPLLGPLADNGGPTLTHALLAGSPALDAGDPAIPNPPATDQRGSVRIVGPAIDMGSVEGGAFVEVPTLSELGLVALCLALLAGGVRRLQLQNSVR